MNGRWRTRSRSWRSSFSRNLGEVEFVFVPEDVERTIEPPAEDDVGARRRQRSVRTQKLNELSVERDGPVVMDLADVFKAEEVVEVDASSGTMDVGESLGVSETSVVIANEEGLQEAVGLVDGGDVLFAQILDETILMSAIGSFDTSLGLRGMSIDAANSEPLQSVAEGG